jgi:hypothetical protein
MPEHRVVLSMSRIAYRLRVWLFVLLPLTLTHPCVPARSLSSFVSSLKSSSQQSYANADKFRQQTHRLQTALMLATEIFNGTHQVENLVDADGGKKIIPLSKNSWQQFPNVLEAGRTIPNGTIQTHHLTFQHFLLKKIKYN